MKRGMNYARYDVSKLSSGYTIIRLNSQCWAQIPESFLGETVPDEYIFQPEWNRDAINKIWKDITPYRASGEGEEKG